MYKHFYAYCFEINTILLCTLALNSSIRGLSCQEFRIKPAEHCNQCQSYVHFFKPGLVNSSLRGSEFNQIVKCLANPHAMCGIINPK